MDSMGYDYSIVPVTERLIEIYPESKMTKAAIDRLLIYIERFIDQVIADEVYCNEDGVAIIDGAGELSVIHCAMHGKQGCNASENFIAVMEMYYQIVVFYYPVADWDLVRQEIDFLEEKISLPLKKDIGIVLHDAKRAKKIVKKFRKRLSITPHNAVTIVLNEMTFSRDRMTGTFNIKQMQETFREWLQPVMEMRKAGHKFTSWTLTQEVNKASTA